MSGILRVYELYETDRGPTCYSVHYKHYSDRVQFVAAKSIRQAYYVAANNIWCQRLGEAGILSESTDRDKPWKHWNGTTEWNVPFIHGDRLGPRRLTQLKKIFG